MTTPGRRDAGTGGGEAIPVTGSTALRNDLGGRGDADSPYLAVVSERVVNFNAATVTVPVLTTETDVLVRIKRVSVDYDTADAPAIGASLHPYINLSAPTAAGALTATSVLSIGPVTLVTRQTHDQLVWDFGDGLILYRPGIPLTSGGWDGNIVFDAAGYAATDDLTVYVELEWWVM